MAVFRCSSGIFAPLVPTVNSQTQAGARTYKRRSCKEKAKATPTGLGRNTAGPSRPSDADLAIKRSRRDRVVRDVQSNKLSHVFVGNLNKNTPEKALVEAFSSCGPVHYVSIRCSVVPSSEYVEGEGIHYAVVVFRDPIAYVRALKLDGCLLDDCFIVVCPTVDDLPEMKRMAEKRAQRSVPKGRELCRQPTLLIDPSNSIGIRPEQVPGCSKSGPRRGKRPQ